MRKIDIFSVIKYLGRKIWIPLLCAAFGAAGMMMLVKEPVPVWNSSVTYSVNVKVRVSAASEQSALDFQNVILDKAEDYLSREYTEAKLSKEAEDMSESVEESPKKKYAALGMLAGLCIGLGGLLAAQYLKSPKIAE